MKAFGAALDLQNDPAIIEDYKEWHRNVWPEVKEALGEVGITAMRIFIIGNHMFMYMEAKDDFEPGRDLQEYRRFPRAMEWGRTDAAAATKGARSRPGRLVGADGACLRPRLGEVAGDATFPGRNLRECVGRRRNPQEARHRAYDAGWYVRG